MFINSTRFLKFCRTQYPSTKWNESKYKMSNWGFPGRASGKEPAYQCRRQETWIQSWSQEDALEEGMATHSNILAWKLPWTEEPGGLQFIHKVAKSWTWLKQFNMPSCMHNVQLDIEFLLSFYKNCHCVLRVSKMVPKEWTKFWK